MQITKEIELRNFHVNPPIAIAPMVGLTHSAFRRLIAKIGGVGLFYSEMLVAKRLPHDNPNSPLLTKSDKEFPLLYQIVTSKTSEISQAVEKIHQLDCQGVDLNLGCPAPMINKQGAGLALAKDLVKLLSIVQELRQRTSLTISAKIRLGRTCESNELQELCKVLEDNGVDLLTIHARLHGEKFCRKPRWQEIKKAKDVVTIPIFANGGIFTVEDAKNCLQSSGADGLMIGRGCVQDPLLCRKIASELYGVEISEPPMTAQKIFHTYFEFLEQIFTPERRLGRLKQFTNYFGKKFVYGHHLITAVQSSRSMDEALERAEYFFVKNKLSSSDIAQ